jgi:hypothetical protein
MKRLTAGTLCLVSLLICGPASADPVRFTSSKYGSFELKNKGDNCEVWFRSTSGAPTKLISASFCSEDKMVTVSEVGSLGGLVLPIASPSGNEFRLFSIPTARGGNGTVSCDYYGVVVSSTRAWASPLFELDQCDPAVDGVALVEEKTGAWLSFRDPPGTVRGGAAYELRMGQLKITPIPKKPRRVVSTTSVVRSGGLGGPFHYTNWKYIIRDGATEHIIDDPGQCALARVADSSVEMTGRLRTWDDGASDLTCTSIKVRK